MADQGLEDSLREGFKGGSSNPLLDNSNVSGLSAAQVAENQAPQNWDGAFQNDEDGDLKNALKIKAAQEDASTSAMLFWECSLRHFFPGFGLSIEERQDGRLIRKELWARFGQPMHFISLNFQDDDVEFDFQMDSTRRNKRWVRYWLIGRAVLGFAIAANNYISQPWLNIIEAGQDNTYTLMFYVYFPGGTGFLFFLQWLQLVVDTEFSLRYFQHQLFFWSLIQEAAVFVFVMIVCQRIIVRPDVCERTWSSIGQTHADIVIVNQEVAASALDQIIKFILSAQILFRLRFIYFLYLNVLLWVVLFLWYTNLDIDGDSLCLPSTTNSRLLPIISLGFAIISYVFELMQRKDFIQASAVFEESERSESLLANVLPQQIIEELKIKGHDHSIVKYYDSVSVLFADIVSFTTMSARLSPSMLVTLLDQLFLAFDRLAEKNNLEKIKTIGDCYMAAGGIPVVNNHHAVDIARMGLAMIAALQSGEFVDPITGVALNVRVGIHTGPAVAGMIGNKKFAYDLWGDAVNTASRMESHGKPMNLHCSHDTWKLLHHVFDCEDRGVMTVKGKGEMNTYFVLKEKEDPEVQSDDDGEDKLMPLPDASPGGGQNMADRPSMMGNFASMAKKVVRTVSSLGFATPEDASGQFGGDQATQSERMQSNPQIGGQTGDSTPKEGRRSSLSPSDSKRRSQQQRGSEKEKAKGIVELTAKSGEKDPESGAEVAAESSGAV